MNPILRLLKCIPILSILLISSPESGYGQTMSMKENWLIGVNGGFNSFFGDLSIYDSNPLEKLMEESDLGYGIFIGKYISPVFTIKSGYLTGNLKGRNDAFQMYFNNSFSEIFLKTDISISRILFPYNNSSFDIYASGGLGSMQSKVVKRQIADNSIIEEHETTFFDTKSVSNSTVIKTGIGCNYSIGENWNATAEVSFMLTGSDLLDAHAGSTGINDYYSYLSIGLSYVINSNRRYYNYSLPCGAKQHPFQRRNSETHQACLPFN